MRNRENIADKNGLTHTHTINVRFSEVDSLNIVWHGNYVKYMEDGREAFGRAFGISYLDVKSHGYSIPIVKLCCEFKKPLKYGETATIETKFVDTDAAKIIFVTNIYNENKELVATGETIQVFLDNNNELCLQNPLFYDEWKHSVLKNTEVYG
jgi:acyl-CoA thioester hydrolase